MPFALAQHFDWSLALIVEDTRQAYPERRFLALGFIDEHLCSWYSHHAKAHCM